MNEKFRLPRELKKKLQLAISATFLVVEPLVFCVELVDIKFLSLFPKVVGSFFVNEFKRVLNYFTQYYVFSQKGISSCSRD